MKKYMAKNDVVIQSKKKKTLQNVEVQLGQLATVLIRPLGNMSPNTKTPKREGKKICKQ